MNTKVALGRFFVLLAAFFLLGGTSLGAGIKVVPSTDRLTPGESFAVEIVAEGIPAEGLGSVQFRLHVDADDSDVLGVSDLGQADADAVSIATPLLISSPTASRSGLGPFFLNGQGSTGILVLDNETFSGGSALFTYAHTKGAQRSSGSGSVARFMVKVGERVEAEEIRISLSDVLLLDGGPEYPLDYNLGATVTLRCNATTPNLAGMTLSGAQQALTDAGLVLGSVYEIDNASGDRLLDVVLEQSVPAGNQALCESAVDVAINTAPADVTGLAAVDKSDDDHGRVVLSWTPSVSIDVAGYRVYEGETLLREVPNPQGSGAEIEGLGNGSAHTLVVKAYDAHGNASPGASVTVTPVDDVMPEVVITGVAEGTYYREAVTVTATATDTHLDRWTATLNGEPFDFSLIDVDGVYTLVITAEDASGNMTQKSVSFTVDKSAPVIDVVNLANDAFYNAVLTPQIAVADANLDESFTAYLLDGHPYLPGTAITEEGSHALAISARDRAGNASSKTVGFVIDLTAPTITLDGVADGVYYNTAVVPQVDISDLNLAQSSLTLNAEAYLDGTPVADEGDYLLLVTATDKAGNTSTITIAFTIDATAPVVTVSGVADGAYYNAAVTPSVAIDDVTLAASETTLNGAPFVNGTELTVDGEYALSVTAADKAGNRSSVAFSFVIDMTAPQIEIAGVADNAYTNADVTPTVTITETWSASTSILLNGAPWTSGTLLSDEGEYALAVNVVDLAGNAVEATRFFMIDKTAPVSASTVGYPQFSAASSLYLTGATEIALSADDDGIASSGVTEILYTLDTQPEMTYATPLTLSGMSDGEHRLFFKAHDRATNSEDDRQLVLILDTGTPVTEITLSGVQAQIGGTFFVDSTTAFVLNAADTYSGVASTEYRIDGGEWRPYAPFTLDGLSDGEHAIGYRSTDNLGNVEATLSLTVVVDNTAPTTTINVSEPKYSGDRLYVTGTTGFALNSSDNLAGVASTEYRLDGGDWRSYAPFTLELLSDGEHAIDYRSTDNLGNVEMTLSLTVVLDNTAPVTTIETGTPQHSADGNLYVTGATGFALRVSDNLAGVASVGYRIDDGEWIAYAPFNLEGISEGAHSIDYRSTDNLGNVETEQTLAVTVDNTPPQTSIQFNHQSYLDGEAVLLSKGSEILLVADDNLSGIGGTFYRFDDEEGWTLYRGVFSLGELSYGAHTIRYRSVDNVENLETEKSIVVTVVGVEVDTSLLNLPRVLVWSEDPEQIKGNNRPAWTAQEVQTLLEDALDVPDVYSTVVTDKESFQREFRSGIYNMTMIINQDVPFDTVFLREMREAVGRGMGLLVSSWGNSVPPLWQEVFGVDFKGSLAMDEADRPLRLYGGVLGEGRDLTASGRVLKTLLDGGTLIGILPAESVCEGVRGISLRYPVEVNVGDRVTATIYAPKGKNLSLLEEESMEVSALPAPAVNRFTGNITGDLAIEAISEEGITVALGASYDDLEGSFSLSLSVEHPDGSRTLLAPVPFTVSCDAGFRPGMMVGPFEVTRVDEDRVASGDDLPAVVLNEYGKGRTIFLAYNLVESALRNERSDHMAMLRNAATYLLPREVAPEAGSVALLETRVKFYGKGMDLLAVERLGEGLTHLPLFDLTQTPLEYIRSLEDKEETAYRYFVRIADERGSYGKETDLSLSLNGGYSLFDTYSYTFAIEEDTDSLMQKALVWVDGQTQETEALLAIRDELVRIGCLPGTTVSELETIIHTVIQTLHHVDQLGFDADELEELLGQYLRITEGKLYFTE